MNKKKRHFTPEYKAKVAVAALNDEKAMAEQSNLGLLSRSPAEM